MPSMLADASFRIASRRPDIAAFADTFEAWCAQHAVPTATAMAFQIAFDELLTNIADYAFADGGEHFIEIHLKNDQHTLQAEVIDDGGEFDPLSDARAPDLDLAIEDRPIGGLGIHLVREMMDQVNYQRRDAHNHLLLIKRLPDPTQ